MASFDPLAVPPTALEHGGVEVLRAAVVQGGLHVSLRRAFDDPQAWGVLIADVARHAARIFAKETQLTEDEALAVFNLGIGLCAVVPEPPDGSLVIGALE